MNKDQLMSYIDSASPKNVKEFATHLVEMLTNSQQKALDPYFSAHFTFNPPDEPEHESAQESPLNASDDELEEEDDSDNESDEELDREVENLL